MTDEEHDIILKRYETWDKYQLIMRIAFLEGKIKNTKDNFRFLFIHLPIRAVAFIGAIYLGFGFLSVLGKLCKNVGFLKHIPEAILGMGSLFIGMIVGTFFYMTIILILNRIFLGELEIE